MCCTGKENVAYDETSSDSNASMTNTECSDDLSMLYLLASVAEEVSLNRGRLNALPTAANHSAPSTSKKESQTTTLPTESKMPEKEVDNGGYDDGRLFRMKCPFCCRCFSRKENLRWHMKKHIKERVSEGVPSLLPPTLPLAEQTAKKKSDLITLASDSRGLWCAKCEKKFQREATFRIHMRFHSRRRPTHSLTKPCKKCGHMSQTKHQYLVHKQMHRMEKVYKGYNIFSEPPKRCKK